MKAEDRNSYPVNKFEHMAGDSTVRRQTVCCPSALYDSVLVESMTHFIETESGTLTILSHLHVTSKIPAAYYTLSVA